VDWQKPQLLDTVAKELFFADNVVFVEGQEDVSLLRRFIESEGLACNFEFFGYGCGGAGNIPVLLQMAKDLGLESAALFDGDKAAEAAIAKATFSDAAIEVLPTDDIRDKHRQEALDGRCRDTDTLWKSGVFDRRGQVKPEHKVALRSIVEKFVAHFDRPVS
jgi:predicted ATP-dependent endonuclease of OLD family